MIQHPIPPIISPECHTLILGSFPSVASRKEAFFYAHRQNRFWPVMAALLGIPLPKTNEERRQMMTDAGYALWDVIASCDIKGSSDASIQNVVPNDLKALIDQSRISRIFCNGKTAFRLYEKYAFPETGITAVCLPSTSPANAAYSLEILLACWHCILL